MTESMIDIAEISDIMAAEDVRPIEIITKEKIILGDPIEVFPAADAFPLMRDTDDEGFQALVADILKNGVNESIKISEQGALVDGRNRAAAILAATAETGGTPPKFTVEVLHKTTPELTDWVISTNLHRRHLTTSQRAMLASDLATATKATGGKNEDAVTVSDAAKMTNVSPRQVKNANQVKKLAEETGDKKVVAEVKAGKKTIGKAQSELKQAKAAAAPVPVAKTAQSKPAAKKAPTKKAPVKKRPPELTPEQLVEVKTMLSLASQPQLVGLRKLINAGLGEKDESETETS